MKAGDLVRIKHDGKVSIVTKVKMQTLEYGTEPMIWVSLHNERLTFNADKLEVLSASR